MTAVWIGVLVFGCMAVEARRAAANERAQVGRGGIEAAHDVYRIMQVAYPAAFLMMLVEGAVREGGTASIAFGVTVFAVAKALKWWAIAALGQFWAFRVIVVPGSTLVASGPYRFVRHPNYVAVVGELIGAALMTGALITGPAATVGFSLLMLRRITVENRALDAILRRG